MTILAAVAEDSMRERVLDMATELGSALEQDLYVVHLVDEASADSAARRLRDEVREYVSDAEVGVTVSVEQVSHSGPRSGPRIAREILDAATSVEITHIVMGHNSKGVVGSIKEGSTAFNVADGTDLPLTIVPATES